MKSIILYAPLCNLGWKYPNFLIDENTKLRFIDEQDENKKLKLFGLDSLKYKSVLIYRYFYKNDDELFGYGSKIAQIMSFLQLYIDNKIYYERYFNIREITNKEELFNKKKPTPIEAEVVNNWKNFNKIYDDYSLSFNWYSRSLDRYVPPREKILFLVISLEGLLLKGIYDELSYRFRLRGAFALGKTIKDRENYFKLLGHAYQLRNCIVHNDANKYKKEISKIGSMHKFRNQLNNFAELLLKTIVINPLLINNIEDRIIKNI